MDDGPRYPKHRLSAREATPLGRAMRPSDVMIELKRLLDLDDDELLQAFAAVAEQLADAPADLPAYRLMGLEGDELAEAIEASAAVTRSRITAWRKRNREMTWPELRALLYGLRSVVLAPADAATR